MPSARRKRCPALSISCLVSRASDSLTTSIRCCASRIRATRLRTSVRSDKNRRRATTLHPHGIDQDLQPGRPPSQDIQQVANGRAAWGSDDPNSARKSWERAFARGIKKSFGVESAFKRVKLRLQQPQSARLQDLHADLVLPASFENGNVAVNLHLRSIDQRLRKRRNGIAKNHARDLCALVLEREILMSAWMQFVIGDFALHPNRTESCLERTANLSRQF